MDLYNHTVVKKNSRLLNFNSNTHKYYSVHDRFKQFYRINVFLLLLLSCFVIRKSNRNNVPCHSINIYILLIVVDSVLKDFSLFYLFNYFILFYFFNL